MKNKIMKIGLQATGIFFLMPVLMNCSGGTSDASSIPAMDPLKDKGIGPVTSVTIGSLDNALAEKGKASFTVKCTPCHNTPDLDTKKIGPSLKGISKIRTPEWIMNQIMNPVEMSQKDPIAKDLFFTYKIQMVSQNIPQDEARSLLEYFRSNDK